MRQLPITITGNLTNDPTLRRVNREAEIARFRVASNRTFREDNEWRQVDNLFVDVECWNQLAANVKLSLHKGDPVHVTGTLVTTEWIDDNGERQQKIILKAHSVGFMLNRHLVSAAKASYYHSPGEPKIPTPYGNPYNPDRFDEVIVGREVLSAHDPRAQEFLEEEAKKPPRALETPEEPTPGAEEQEPEPAEDITASIAANPVPAF